MKGKGSKGRKQVGRSTKTKRGLYGNGKNAGGGGSSKGHEKGY